MKFRSLFLVDGDGLTSLSGVVDVDGEEVGGNVASEEVLKSEEVGDENVNCSCSERHEKRSEVSKTVTRRENTILTVG